MYDFTQKFGTVHILFCPVPCKLNEQPLMTRAYLHSIHHEMRICHGEASEIRLLRQS